MKGWPMQMVVPSVASSRRSPLGIQEVSIAGMSSTGKSITNSDKGIDHGNGSPDAMAPIRNIMQGLPPILSTIHEQTGIAPPSWFAEMPKSNDLNGKPLQTESHPLN